MAQNPSLVVHRALLALARHVRGLLPASRREAIAHQGFVGRLEIPVAGTSCGGHLTVSGWLFGRTLPVLALRVSLGGVSLGTLQVNGLRRDVTRLFPFLDPGLACGFRGHLSVPQGLAGKAELAIWAVDPHGGAQRCFACHLFALPERGFEQSTSYGALEATNAHATDPSVEHGPSRHDDQTVGNPPMAWASLRAHCDKRAMQTMLIARASQMGASRTPTCSIIVPVFDRCDLTFRCLLSVLFAKGQTRFEVIVVDDGSRDHTPELLECFGKGITVVRSEENLGFVRACNLGAVQARGRYLVFLNNDVEVGPHWLDELRQTTRAFEQVGAVGAKLVFPNGRLQEAGGVVFEDGSAANFGRGADPRLPDYCFARPVDYCSAACLLVRRDLFEQLGGFDLRYAPGYYEDTDLCFGLWQLGYKVIYQPMCEVIHEEGGTAGRDEAPAGPLAQTWWLPPPDGGNGAKRFQSVNQRKFHAKWRAILGEQRPFQEAEDRADRRCGPRLLVIDHQVPQFDQDSGSLRAFMMVRLLSTQMDCRVTFMTRGTNTSDRYCQELGRVGVRVVEEEDAFRELGERRFDLVIIAREEIARDYLDPVRRVAPKVPVVFDTVDVHFVRELRAAALNNDEAARQAALRTKASEVRICRQCDLTIAVTDADREHLLKQDRSLRVAVVPNIHEPSDTNVTAEGRSSLMFVGGFSHDPNVDAMLYFVRHVLPVIRTELGHVKLDIVGSRPPQAIVDLQCEHIQVWGYVPDLSPYYRRARVFVAPLRYGAGMKGKVGEALAHGVPVVTTEIGAEGMGLVHETTCLLAAIEPASEFARAVGRLWTDDRAWRQLAAAGKALVAERFSPEAVAPALSVLVDVALRRRVPRVRLPTPARFAEA